MHKKYKVLIGGVIVFGLIAVGSQSSNLFKGALVGQSVALPTECTSLATARANESDTTLNVGIVFIRDVNLNFKDSDFPGAGKLDSKLSQEEAQYFCKKFLEFKRNIESTTPVKFNVSKIIDLKEPVTNLTKASGSTVIGGVQSVSMDYKIGPGDLPELDIEPGDLDLYFAVYDNEELLNIVVPNNANAKLHASASTYRPNKDSYGAVPIFVQAKEVWISQNNNLSHILAHEFTHYLETALEINGKESINIHAYAENHSQGQLAAGVPNQDWVYSVNSAGKTGYESEKVFMNYIFNNILTAGNLWSNISIREMGPKLAKGSSRGSGRTLGSKEVKRTEPNIVEVPIFENKGSYYEVVFTAQALQNSNFKFLAKQNQTNSIGEVNLAKTVNPAWIISKTEEVHANNDEIHKKYRDLPHYEEPHTHFVLNIPVSEIGQAKYIKIWAQDGFASVNPESSQ